MKAAQTISALMFLLGVTALEAGNKITATTYKATIKVPGENKTAGTEFVNKAMQTSMVCLCINAVAAMGRDNFIPMKAFLPAAGIIGAGMGTLRYLDNRALAKDPSCGANKRNNRLLKSLVIAAGLAPIILSNSESGKLIRKHLAPAYEALLQAGSYVGTCLLNNLPGLR